MQRTLYPAASSLGTSRPPTYPVAPVTSTLPSMPVIRGCLSYRCLYVQSFYFRSAARASLQHSCYILHHPVQLKGAKLTMDPLLDANDLELARRYAPVLLFDGAEPFLPSLVGY